MAIPPQFLKHTKAKGKEKEGKAEPGDSPAEDMAEGDTPPAKKSNKKKGSSSNAKRAALLAQLRGGK